MNSGNDFRDHIAALLGTRHDNVRTEIQITAKKADICFDIQTGPGRCIKVAAECKKWNRALTRDIVKDILADYDPAFLNRQIDALWIICDQTPAPGARDFVDAYPQCQLMTAMECEQALIDFQPLLNYLANDFNNDPISNYYIPPAYYVDDGKANLDAHVTAWLEGQAESPIAIWAGYGMGKTTYARFLAARLARHCLENYGARIPILLNLGDFSTAPDLETLIVTQLTNHYGVRYCSAVAFRLLNARHRFVLILDGFDEMKFAMAPNDFNYISSQMRKTAAVNPRLLLLGRPDSIESEEEARRLTSSKLQVQNVRLKADDAPDFTSVRICFLEKDEYLSLIRNFLTYATEREPNRKPVADIMASIETLSLDDVLERPVQAKMLAEVVADPNADISAISRFSLYDLFIKRILRREEEKSVRRHLGSQQRTHFMRLLAWWLWTEKKTRTFAANEIPLEIIQKFQIPNVSLDGLRRELLIGSIIEERNIGHFLSEKTAGIFYFPHTSFTEFLVADYIMSSDFMSIDVAKLPVALYGEVPTFLNEHPTPNTILTIYKRMKSAQIAMTTSCMTVLLNDLDTRMHIDVVDAATGDPWDICMRYFLLHAENTPVRARKFLMDCLHTHKPQTELAAMYCLMYEEVLAPTGRSAVAHLILHLFQRIGVNDLISASEREFTTARTQELNHLAEVTSSCIQLSRDAVIFDFAEFTSAVLSFISTSCAVSDVVDRIPKTYAIPANDIISLTPDAQERIALADLIRHQGRLRVIPASTSILE